MAILMNWFILPISCCLNVQTARHQDKCQTSQGTANQQSDQLCSLFCKAFCHAEAGTS